VLAYTPRESTNATSLDFFFLSFRASLDNQNPELVAYGQPTQRPVRHAGSFDAVQLLLERART